MKFIYGTESYLIAKELKKIRTSSDCTPIIYGDESDISTIINEIFTISMFSNEKLIILKNITAFSKDDEGRDLIKELEDFNDPNVEIVFVYEGLLNKKATLVEFLLKNVDVIEIKTITDKEIISIIKEVVVSNGGTISNSATIKLANKLPLNLRIVIMEIKKLLFEKKDIDIEQIENSIGEYNKIDFFALSNAITSGIPHEIIKTYQERIANGEEPINIINQIASVFNLVFKVMSYKNIGYSAQDIATKLNIHIYRIQKSLEICNSTSEEKIKTIISDLSELDTNIKNGKINPVIGLDYFILNMVK